MQAFTIAQIEQAINAWREAEGVHNHKLGSMTRKVADVYGRMIYDRATAIDASALSVAERHAVEHILSWPSGQPPLNSKDEHVKAF